jgi:hypothetical protein
MSTYEITVAQAAPIMPYFGIRSALKRMFVTAAARSCASR